MALCRAARPAAIQPQPKPKLQPQPKPAARTSAAASAASSADSHPAAAADPGAFRRTAVQEVVSASGMGCGSALALQGAPMAPGNHWTTRYRRLDWQQQGRGAVSDRTGEAVLLAVGETGPKAARHSESCTALESVHCTVQDLMLLKTGR